MSDRDPDNFDYVQLADDSIYTIHGDRHPDGSAIGFPTYRPDPDGDREFRGLAVSRFPRNPVPVPDAAFYSTTPVDHRCYQFPTKHVKDTIQPAEATEAAVQQFPLEKQELFQQVRETVETYDLDTYVAGSDLLGIANDSSDLDILVLGDDLDFPVYQELYQELQGQDGLTAPPLDIDQYTDKIQERYGVPEPVARFHAVRDRKKLASSDGEIDIDIVPSQRPGTWTDYHLPETGDVSFPVEIEGVVTDDSRSQFVPLGYTLDTEFGELDVVSYSYIWRTLTEGDEVSVTGDMFPAGNTVYMRDHSHFIAPAELARDNDLHL